jgi:5-methyltetrahydropteroyltriglutamate--homocysteine methyltransferase
MTELLEPRTSRDRPPFRADHVGNLKRRMDEASKYVPLDQPCLSPECGFSSTVEGNDLSLHEQLAKLRLVVETAEEVWG